MMVQGNIERERERSQRGLWKTATGTSQDVETPDVRVMLCVLSRSVMSHSLQPHGLLSTRLLCPWNSPAKNTGVGCQALLQGMFPNQGSKLGLLHCRQILYHLSHQSSPFQLIGDLIFKGQLLTQYTVTCVSFSCAHLCGSCWKWVQGVVSHVPG